MSCWWLESFHSYCYVSFGTIPSTEDQFHFLFYFLLLRLSIVPHQEWMDSRTPNQTYHLPPLAHLDWVWEISSNKKFLLFHLCPGFKLVSFKVIFLVKDCPDLFQLLLDSFKVLEMLTAMAKVQFMAKEEVKTGQVKTQSWNGLH